MRKNALVFIFAIVALWAPYGHSENVSENNCETFLQRQWRLSPTARALRLVKQNIHEALNPPASFFNEVQSGDAEGYLNGVATLHDNEEMLRQAAEIRQSAEKADPSAIVYAPLKGINPDREVKQQQAAAVNGLDSIPVYMRYSTNPNEKPTHSHLMRLWQRPEHGEEESEEWLEALQYFARLIEQTEQYRDIIGEKVAEGFEAYQKFNSLTSALKNLGPGDFVYSNDQGLTLRQSHTFSWDSYVYNSETEQLEKEVRSKSYLSYADVVAEREAAYKEYASAFGKPMGPGAVFLQQLPNKKTAQAFWQDFKNVFTWNPIRFGVQGVNFVVGNLWNLVFDGTLGGAVRFGRGTLKWMKSLFVLNGQMQNIYRSQAFNRLRLQLAWQTLENRKVELGYTLNGQEKKLIDKIVRVLGDPRLAPSSAFVGQTQSYMLRDELRYKSGKPLAGYEVSTENRDPHENHGRSVEKEDIESTSFGRWLGSMFRKHQKTALFGVALLSGTLGYNGDYIANRVSLVFTENPYFSYYSSLITKEINDYAIEWVGTTPEVRAQSVASARDWSLKAPVIEKAIEERFRSYIQHQRVNPDYNMFSDPEFLEEVQHLTEKEILPLREEYQIAAVYQFIHNQLVEKAIPKRVVTLMTNIYKEHYPKEFHQRIDEFMNLFVSNNFQPNSTTDLLLQRPSTKEESQLLADLKYFVTRGYGLALKHYHDDNFGSLSGFEGSPYQKFGQSPGEFVVLKKGFVVRSEPQRSNNNTILTVDIEGIKAIAVGEPSANGYQMIEIIGDTPSSPTGVYYIHYTGVSAN